MCVRERERETDRQRKTMINTDGKLSCERWRYGLTERQRDIKMERRVSNRLGEKRDRERDE